MTHNRQISISLWVPRFWPAMGGTELHTRRLAEELSCQHNMSVITHCDISQEKNKGLELDVASTNDGSYLDGNVRINRIAMGNNHWQPIKTLARLHSRHRFLRPAYSVLFFILMLRKSMKLTPDTQIIHFVYNGLTDSAMLAASIARLRNIPFVLTPNILNTSENAHAWNSRRFRRLYESASRIIALTQHEADWLQKQNVPKQKITVVPYGPILDDESSGERFRIQTKTTEARIVLFLGRIVRIKGYDLLLDACQELWRSHPQTRIIFMGPACDESRSAILASQDPRIMLLENFNQSFKADALAACDVLCVPSRVESLGVVYIEAAYHAKPVVALDIQVLREVIDHGTDGLLVEESAKEVARALIFLLENPEKAAEMGRDAQAKAIAKYNWTSVGGKISNIYREVLSDRK